MPRPAIKNVQTGRTTNLHPLVIVSLSLYLCYLDAGSDNVDPRSFLSTLSSVVQSGIHVLVWAGDADWICNWLGNYRVANAVDFSGHAEFSAKDLAPYTVNGTEKGMFKNVDNFSFLKVYGAGHEVPYYRESLVQIIL